uniref:UDENN domain-containing protein n=1 Tax=Globodera pallida TaxID=36090 RepID=A0A183BLA4_GLOPA
MDASIVDQKRLNNNNNNKKQQNDPMAPRRSVSLSMPPTSSSSSTAAHGPEEQPKQSSIVRMSISGPSESPCSTSRPAVNIVPPTEGALHQQNVEAVGRRRPLQPTVPDSSSTSTLNLANSSGPGKTSSKSPSPQYRRKASLMPPVTEEDLRNDFRMGHRDPESVAALFGDDFASRFCSNAMPLSMQQLRQGLDPDQALLPHEIRDASVPSGVPIVKMRRRVGTQPASTLLGSAGGGGGNNDGTDEAVVPLSPMAPKFPSLPCFLSAFTSAAPAAQSSTAHPTLVATPSAPPILQIPGIVRPSPVPFPLQFERNRSGQNRLVPFRMPEPGQFYPDMAVSNPDLVQFQLVLNDWFRRQCNVRTSAFLLNSAELNVTLCQVCGTELAHEEGGAIQCGDADYLDRLFDGCAAVASCSFSADGRATAEAGGRRQQRPIGTMRQSPVVVRLDALSEVDGRAYFIRHFESEHKQKNGQKRKSKFGDI